MMRAMIVIFTVRVNLLDYILFSIVIIISDFDYQV